MTGPRHARWRERWARQENERRARVHQAAMAAWQHRDAELRRRLEAATAHRPSPAGGSDWLRGKRGETVYWVAGGVGMVETPYVVGLQPPDHRRPPDVEIPAIAGPPTDTGQVAVTSQRVVFAGRVRREWAYAKLTGLAHTTSGQTLMLVSNRKKVSGVVPPPGAVADLRLQLALAMSDAAGDRAGLVAGLREQVERHHRLAPRLPAPATPDQAPWTARLGTGGTVAVAAGAALLFFLAVGTALASTDQPAAPQSQPQAQSSSAASRVPAAAAKSPVPSPTPAEPTATSSPASEPAAAAPPPQPAGDCDAYVDSDRWCVDGAGDYDCAGGTGNGPNYVGGPVRVADPGQDPFGLDRDGDGRACEREAADPAPAPPPPADDGTDPRFDTCKAAIAAGYGSYRRGQDPEYDWYRDADGDGVVCE